MRPFIPKCHFSVRSHSLWVCNRFEKDPKRPLTKSLWNKFAVDWVDFGSQSFDILWPSLVSIECFRPLALVWPFYFRPAHMYSNFFFFVFSIVQLVDEIWLCLDSNCGSQVSEATTLPTACILNFIVIAILYEWVCLDEGVCVCECVGVVCVSLGWKVFYRLCQT